MIAYKAIGFESGYPIPRKRPNFRTNFRDHGTSGTFEKYPGSCGSRKSRYYCFWIFVVLGATKVSVQVEMLLVTDRAQI